jgi:hypothetical protein
MESNSKANTKRIYHKPLYGLTKKQCLTKHYRRFINGRCSYKKCRGKSHYYNKYGKCLSMKHYGDIEPSHKKRYRGKDPRRICESTHRGSNWRYYDGKCYRKTCKTKGSVFAYYNGRCTPRPQYLKHLMLMFRTIEMNTEQKIKNAKSHSEFTGILNSAKKNVENAKKNAYEVLDNIKKTDKPTSDIKHAKAEQIISKETADKLEDAHTTNSKKNIIIDNEKKNVSKQAFGVIENLKDRIKSIMNRENKQTTL